MEMCFVVSNSYSFNPYCTESQRFSCSLLVTYYTLNLFIHELMQCRIQSTFLRSKSKVLELTVRELHHYKPSAHYKTLTSVWNIGFSAEKKAIICVIVSQTLRAKGYD